MNGLYGLICMGWAIHTKNHVGFVFVQNNKKKIPTIIFGNCRGKKKLKMIF
jgi:hypothetical protein